MTVPTLQEFLLELLQKAKANDALMDGTVEPVKRIIDSNDVVFALWPERRHPYGFETMVIKGQVHLARIAAMTCGEVPLKTSAITCENYEMAIAARNVLGDREKTTLS